MKAMKTLFFLLAIVFSFGLFANQAAALTITENRLNINEISSCSVSLQWEIDSPGADENFTYWLRREGNGLMNFHQINVVKDNSRTRGYNAVNSDLAFLLPGQSYDYILEARPSAGNIVRIQNSVDLDAIGAAPNLPVGTQAIWEAEGERLSLRIAPAGDHNANNAYSGFHFRRFANNREQNLIYTDRFVLRSDPTIGHGISSGPDIFYRYEITPFQTAANCFPGEFDFGDSDRLILNRNSSSIIVPENPAGLSAGTPIQNGQGFSVVLRWSQPTDDILSRISQYVLEVKEQGESWDNPPVREFPTRNDVSMTIPLNQAGVYQARLQAVNQSGNFSASSSYVYSQDFSTSLQGPANTKINLQGLSFAGNQPRGSIYLYWEDGGPNSHDTEIFKENLAGGGRQLDRRISWGQILGQDYADLDNRIRKFSISDNDRNFLFLDSSYRYYVVFVYFNDLDGDNIKDQGEEVERVENSAVININDLKPVSGWVWGSNLGWIKLNNEDPSGQTINYGVYVNNQDRLMGYGWSSNAGWVSFNGGDLTGCPDNSDGDCVAPRRENNQIIGWAKFLSADPQLGSWTGWLHLSSSVDGNGPDRPADEEEERPVQGGLGLGNFFSSIIESFSNLLRN